MNGFGFIQYDNEEDPKDIVPGENTVVLGFVLDANDASVISLQPTVSLIFLILTLLKYHIRPHRL